MKVKRNTLLLIACLVWSTAGVNILHIGLTAYPAYRSLLNYLLSVLVFAVFQKFVFGKLVKKHTAGIALRTSGLAPKRFIAVFYTGLGASLLAAGLLFGRNYSRALSAAKAQK